MSARSIAGLLLLAQVAHGYPRKVDTKTVQAKTDYDDRGEEIVYYCGEASPEPATDQPSLLMLGDSVSCNYRLMFYTLGLLENAGVNWKHVGGCGSDTAVQVPWAQGNTRYGKYCTNMDNEGNWLNFTGTYDVILFNFGLHDLEQDHPYDDELGPSQHVPLEDYGNNLRTIYDRLSQKARKVIWASTTPAPIISLDDCPLCRQNSDVEAYNAKALEVLPDDATVFDLNKVVNDHCGAEFTACDDWMNPGDVHFEGPGQEALCHAIFDDLMTTYDSMASEGTIDHAPTHDGASSSSTAATAARR
jgi:hypothetical protein